MSHLPPPPPYSETPVNPDQRPLPDGWIQQYDSRHKEWFYVNTRAEPVVTQWTHPLGSASSSSSTQYAPPPGPPPARASDRKPSVSRSSDYPPMPGSYGPVYDPYPYAGYASSSHRENGGVAGFLGNILDSRVQVRQSRFERKIERKMARHHRKKDRIGLKGLAVAGGAALLGGLLLGEAF